jgi:hypothetical protein
MLLGALLAAPAHARPNPPTAPENNDFGALTAVWWKWVYDHEAVAVGRTNTFPILDTTGQFAAVGQRNGIGPANKFFFLVGTFPDAGKVTRTVTVPRGKALFFPIINIETDNAVAPPPPRPFTVPQLRQQAKDAIDTATGLAATFDREPVRIFRAVSPVFAYTLPANNSIYDFFELVGPQFEGTVKPAVGDGYWSYIPPPAPGQHVLKFRSANVNDFTLDVTYHLTVA